MHEFVSQFHLLHGQRNVTPTRSIEVNQRLLVNRTDLYSDVLLENATYAVPFLDKRNVLLRLWHFSWRLRAHERRWNLIDGLVVEPLLHEDLFELPALGRLVLER